MFSVMSSDGNGPNLFDTEDNTTSDHAGHADLLPPLNTDGVGGNLLIIQSDTDGGGLANDFAGGGTITFELMSGPSLSFVGALAIDDGTFGLSTSVDGLLGELTLGENEPGSTTFASSFLNVGDTFFIDFSGSGAVDSLVFEDGLTAVPVPAALPLMLIGLDGFGLVARRRETRAS